MQSNLFNYLQNIYKILTFVVISNHFYSIVMRKLFIFIVILSFFACQNNNNNGETANQTATEKMVGEWDSYSVLIKVKSMKQTGGDSVVNIPNPAAFAQITGNKPIHTIYRADGSYTAEYRNLKDSILFVNLGEWKMLNDSILQLNQQDPFPETSEFGVRFMKDGAMFSRAAYDYDRDGAKDDSFLGMQTKRVQ
jgi:hypothetical protein